MAVFISDPQIGISDPLHVSSLESDGARSLVEQQSSRYENVASSAPPSSDRPSILQLADSSVGASTAPPRTAPSLRHSRRHIPAARRSLPSPVSVHSSSLKRLSAHQQSTRSVLSLSRPATFIGRAKSLYERSPLRHFGPWLLLLLYALAGALLFFWLEAANERQLVQRELSHLGRLREETAQRLGRTSRQEQRHALLQWFERELAKAKLSEALPWDFWGALFYVGSVFTTIGYGNITPRTRAGQALSILYAIVGIPLVLALLSQTSKRMTRWLSNAWMRQEREGTVASI